VHAAVLRGKDNTIFVIDLGSSHGTFVSGKRLEPYVAVPVHDRSVIVFGQSSRRYIVREFPKDVSGCSDAEEANTLINCMVGYKQESPCTSAAATTSETNIEMDDALPPKLERRVSFSCMAPEIIPMPIASSSTPPSQEGSSTPLSVMGGSPEVTWFRKSIQTSPRTSLLEMSLSTSPELPLFRNKSDSLPSIQVNSGSDEDDEGSSSIESLELSPILSTIDETKSVIISDTHAPVGRKSFYKRLPARFEVFSKRVKPDT
jgi:hypothetical protein